MGNAIQRIILLGVAIVAGVYGLTGCNAGGTFQPWPHGAPTPPAPAPFVVDPQTGQPVPAPPSWSRTVAEQSIPVAQNVSAVGQAASEVPVVGEYAAMADRFGAAYADEVATRLALMQQQGGGSDLDNITTMVLGAIAGVGGALGFRRVRPNGGASAVAGAPQGYIGGYPGYAAPPGFVPSVSWAPAAPAANPPRNQEASS